MDLWFYQVILFTLHPIRSPIFFTQNFTLLLAASLMFADVTLCSYTLESRDTLMSSPCLLARPTEFAMLAGSVGGGRRDGTRCTGPAPLQLTRDTRDTNLQNCGPRTQGGGGGGGANTGHREHISIGQHRQPMVESFPKNRK